jgi:hypothetical protein
LTPCNEEPGGSKLREMNFFQRLVEKEHEHYEKYKENLISAMNSPQFMDESRFF